MNGKIPPFKPNLPEPKEAPSYNGDDGDLVNLQDQITYNLYSVNSSIYGLQTQIKQVTLTLEGELKDLMKVVNNLQNFLNSHSYGSGSTGPSFTGYTGYTGYSGPAGYTGSPGPAGPTGYTGPQIPITSNIGQVQIYNGSGFAGVLGSFVDSGGPNPGTISLTDPSGDVGLGSASGFVVNSWNGSRGGSVNLNPGTLNIGYNSGSGWVQNVVLNGQTGTAIVTAQNGVGISVTGDANNNDIQDWYINGSGSPVISINSTGGLVLNNLPIYANNAAAVSGGLTAGNLYRTGVDPDPVCVVH